MNGAQWLVKELYRRNINIVFGYPGGAIMPIYDALLDSNIEHILCRHEQGAILAAIGYARSSGRIGVCFATSGPGVTNIITGLADALLDSVSIIAITGQVGLKFIGTDAFQEVDVLGLSLACTKHSFLVESVDILPFIVNEAFLISCKGRPGPVLIDIPKDIQLSNSVKFSDETYNMSLKYGVCDVAKQSYCDKIDLARVLMRQSHKPIVYVGGGVGIGHAVEKLRFFISSTGIPSVVTLKGIGAVNYNDVCYLGMLGMHGNQSANLAVQDCDLLIAIGTRFDDRVTGSVDTFAPNAKVIHLDIDASEFNKLRRADVVLQGDLNYFLSMLIQPLIIDDWRLKVQYLKKQYRWCYNSISDNIYAPALLKYVSDRLPKNAVVTTDVGQHQMWVAQHMYFDKPENFITSGGLGTMGFGIPAAIGAQIARPDDMVICVSGDGSFMMNIQELTTIKRKKLPIKIILLDNRRLGMVRQWQELFFNHRYSETVLTDNPNFLVLASSFDINGIYILRKDQVLNAIDILFNNDGPFLLHVAINELENVWPLVPPGSSNDNMLER